MSRIGLASAFAATLVVTAIAPLRVIRFAPEGDADPTPEISVTFDRPVAGGLAASVDADEVFSIDPDVSGSVEWRDPFTIRFVPDSALRPGASYTVRISSDFQAMDGNSLSEPYQHTFTVARGRVLNGFPVRKEGYAAPRHIGERPLLRFLVRPLLIEPDRFASRTKIRMLAPCSRQEIGVEFVDQREMNDSDPSFFRWEEWHPRIDMGDDGRRVVELRPSEDLPRGCSGTLSFPADDGATNDSYTWNFSTYGPLRVTSAICSSGGNCPTGPMGLWFSNPVKGADLLRHVRIEPEVELSVVDTADVRTQWSLNGAFAPRSAYRISFVPALPDVFGQALTLDSAFTVNTTGYGPSVSYAQGRVLVERDQGGTLPVHHINTDTVVVEIADVPQRFEGAFLASQYGWRGPWDSIAGTSRTLRLPVPSPTDEGWVSAIPLSADNGNTTLRAVRIAAQVSDTAVGPRPIALTQVTDLGVHARVGKAQATVWVTRVSDGRAVPGARVTLYDPTGSTRGSGLTNAQGLVELANLGRANQDEACAWECYGFEGYVAAEVVGDRAVVGLSRYDPDLAPWRFDLYPAWGATELPLAAAVFTDRGIYRPGEPVHAKAILRRGTLGALSAPSGDSLRWRWLDRERETLRDTVVVLSDYGTAAQTLDLDRNVPVGNYTLNVQAVVQGQWEDVGGAFFRVAEYRPPEFLFDAVADRPFGLAGDTASVTLSGRYLFGAPMSGAPTQWSMRVEPIYWGLTIPGAEGFSFGAGYGWWDGGRTRGTEVTASGVDTLGAQGTVDLPITLSGSVPGQAMRGTLQATVTDANRQASTATASLVIHPGGFYIGAQTPSDSWFWTEGEPARVDVIAVRPDGERVFDVAISAQVVRREWHRVRRLRDGEFEEVGQWVTDTVAACSLVTNVEPVPCDFTPPGGGSYRIDLEARDAQDRVVRTELYRWAAGEDWVPWNDESKLNMDVIVDRESYDIGDTATVLFASPFTDAEAWVTVEREQVLQSHRLRITSGATTFKLPITEALAPNAFVSIVVAKGRTAAPSGMDDPGRPTIRVGYAQIRVLPEIKRLAVEIEALPGARSPQPLAVSTGIGSPPVTYEPGDTARFDLRVRDQDGVGVPSEVTLWAVDEGVLALTGYATPDPVSLIYQERGLGVRLGSNLTVVAAQIPEGQKGRREPGGGGGGDAASVLRSRFQTTAFFLGSVETDSAGMADVSAGLPDNLTTFRVMAVAVTRGDRYGSGDTEILVTRPLLVRPSLPRFVRADDEFRAGVVVNQRLGIPLNVRVQADAAGINLEGDSSVGSTLDPLRGSETRFGFRAIEGDSAHFEFAVSGSPVDTVDLPESVDLRDAVRVSLPVRPAFYALASSAAGALTSIPQSVSIPLRNDVDPERSWVEVSFGTTPLSVMRAIEGRLRIYPYFCTEQVTSTTLAMLARYRLEAASGNVDEDAAARIQDAIRILESRQRSDGALGYWSGSSWSTAWLSGYSGRVLLEAQRAGFVVDSTTLSRLTDYVLRTLEDEEAGRRMAFAGWIPSTGVYRLGERLMAADFLSRAGVPNVPVENDLFANVSLMRWEDQVLLSEVLGRSGRMDEAAAVLKAVWDEVKIEGRKATPPDEGEEQHYFRSRIRGTARLLSATLVVQPDHPHIGALMESLLDRSRTGTRYWWNTQDYAYAVLAAADVAERQQLAGPASIRIRGRPGIVADLEAAAGDDTTFSLDGLVASNAEGEARLQLAFGRGAVPEGTASTGVTAPVYYFVTVHEVPKGRAVEPVYRGITVERWYEDLETGAPIVSIDEGELVRVGIRVTLSEDRQFVVVDDPLPAGLEAVDLSLRTVRPPGARFDGYQTDEQSPRWFGSWNSGLWSPFEHQEIRDDRVVYSSSYMQTGSYRTSYVARATTAGTFVVPPAHAEEMYNPGVNGRTGGSTFTVREGAGR